MNTSLCVVSINFRYLARTATNSAVNKYVSHILAFATHYFQQFTIGRQSDSLKKKNEIMSSVARKTPAIIAKDQCYYYR